VGVGEIVDVDVGSADGELPTVARAVGEVAVVASEVVGGGAEEGSGPELHPTRATSISNPSGACL